LDAPQTDRQPKVCGVLAVRAEAADGVVTVELSAVHCAASMAFCYTADGGHGTSQVMLRSSARRWFAEPLRRTIPNAC
jgi:hypothetical protein